MYTASGDSSGGVAGYGMDSRGSSLEKENTFFPISTASMPVMSPTEPPIPQVPEALSRGIKRPGLEAEHSPSCSAGLKNGGAVPQTPPPPSLNDVTFSTFVIWLLIHLVD
jgi:hypothetical protein